MTRKTPQRVTQRYLVAKSKTSPEARKEILNHLESKRWRVSPNLKVPHATSPDGDLRLWFKPQAVYFSVGRHNLGDARTISYDFDIRKMDGPKFLATVDRMDLVKRAEELAEKFKSASTLVALRYVEARSPDLWLSRQAVEKLCPSCALKMDTLGIREIKASLLFEKFGAVVRNLSQLQTYLRKLGPSYFAKQTKDGYSIYQSYGQGKRLLAEGKTPSEAIEKFRNTKHAAWEALPKGWTQDSLKSFWDSLVGDVRHKVTKCIKELEGKEGISDAGAMCASLADKMDPGWRSRD